MIGAAVKFVLVVCLTLAVFAGAVYAFRGLLIYPFGDLEQPPGEMPRTEVRTIPAFGDDPALTVWLAEPEPGEAYVIYFMGHSGSLSVHEPRMRALADAGFGIAAMAYRGGAGQAGTPSEATLMQDARRLYAGLDALAGREVRDTERVIYGFSFGALIATKLAAEQEELALVLEAPGQRLCEMDFNGYALLPFCGLFTGHDFDIRDDIARVETPVLLLMGDSDQVAGSAGTALFAAAPEPKFRKTYRGGDHADLGRFGAAKDAIAFIRTLRGQR